MNYINPFILLQLDYETSSGLETSTIRKSKKNLLADIELTDSETTNYKGIELSKSDCIRAIDELDNNNKRDFHLYIAQNKALLEFLTDGNIQFFEQYRVESIYNVPEFIEFVSPFFSYQYDKKLFEYFKSKNIEKTKLVLLNKPLVNETYLETSYKSVYSYLREIDKEFLLINKQLDNDEMSNINVAEINTNLINTLPNYFQGIRNQLAETLRMVAVQVNNKTLRNYKLAFEIINTANNINIDGITKQKVVKNFYIIKENYSNTLKTSIEETPLPVTQKKKISEDEINKLIQDYDKQEKEKKEKNNTVLGLLLLLGFLAWAYFYTTVGHIARIIVLILYLSWLGTIIKNGIKGRPKSEFYLYSVSLLLSIISFYYPILFTAVLIFFAVAIIHSLLLIAIDNQTKKNRSWYYLIIALGITYFLWDYENSKTNNLTEESQTFINPPISPTKNEAVIDSSAKPSYIEPVINNPSSNDNNSYTYPLILNGNISNCSDIKEKYDYNIENKLKISVGQNSDAVIKLINYANDKCIRYVYIRKNTTYSITNIPEGKYYLKIAYGEKWGVKEFESNCQGRFTNNTYYKKGDEILDYNLVQNKNGSYQIPSYSLKLNIIFSINDNSNSFQTDNISENDFYNN